ncbi:DUF5018 domain-containing protein, partial [Bacteroidales bacterium OttesenSCG-928-I21]|nr:DUF5018 domain-containing protein [Bacteroidales bacterium OttesenSCG-928-I21]
IPYDCDFSNVSENNAWVLANGTQTNKWYIGSTTSGSNTVSEGLYISNNNGASNAYSTDYESHVYAYRTINFAQVGTYNISFDWRAYGEGSWDYLRAFLVPVSQTNNLTGGNTNSIGTSGAPTNWIDLTNGKLNLASNIQDLSSEVEVNTAGIYQLVFYWRNDGSSGTQPPAAVDNISITRILCPTPNPTISGVSDLSATVTCNGYPAWNIILSTTSISNFDDVTPTVSSHTGSSYTFTDLNQSTSYYVYVQGICENDELTDWISAEFTTVSTPAELPYECDFSDADENNYWVLANGTQTNKWYIGSTTSGSNTVSEGLYISNDNGASNAYSTGSTSYVYAYRTIKFTQTGTHKISFDWRAYGESCCDYLRVFLVPASQTSSLTGGTTNSIGTSGAPTGWIAITTDKLNYQSAWQSANYNVNIATAGVYQLVFFWKNDSSSGTQPPASVDNISVRPPSSENDILSFSFTSETRAAIIDTENHTVDAEVSYSLESLAGLVPTITISNYATITPNSGVAQDFTNAVEYTVRAENQEQQVWTVSVSQAQELSAANDILTFVVAGQVGESIIDNDAHTVNFTMPYGSVVTGIYPAITISRLATIDINAVRDFSEPLVYVVTAENGDEQPWTVTANIIPASTAKDILSFSVANQIGETIINTEDHTIDFTLAYGSSVTALVPTITISEFASIDPNSGVAQDFTTPIEYIVTAQDASTQEWTATANIVPPSTAKDILSFSVTNQVGESIIDDDAHTVIFTMPYGTDVSSLRPIITVSEHATIFPLSNTARDFTAPVEYTVTAQDASTQAWTVTVEVAPASSANDIVSFTIVDQVGESVIDAVSKTVNAVVRFDSNRARLIPTIGVSEFASILPLSGVMQDFSAPVEYTVKAQNEEEAIWTVNIALDAVPAGANCNNPIIIDFASDLPYSAEEQSTCGLGYEHENVSLCSTGGGNGESATYRLDVDVISYVEFTLNPNRTSNSSIALYSDCPAENTHLDCNVSTSGLTMTIERVLTPGTYYLVVDVNTTEACIPDYDLSIAVNYDVCLPVTDLRLSLLEQEQATVTWTAGYIESEWNLKHGPRGFNIETEGTSVNGIQTNSYNITELTINSNYDVYVQAACTDELTEWTGPLSFTTLRSCPYPAEITIEDIQSDAATITWEGYTASQWELIISDSFIVDPDEYTGDIISRTTESYNAVGLAPNTVYFVYLRAVCDVDTYSYWTYATSFTTLQVPAELPYSYDFEDADENAVWTLVNEGQTNAWVIGSATNNGGTNGLYVSNNGVANAYSNTVSYSYAYRKINFTGTDPSEVILVEFDWKSNGETNNDVVSAYLIPASVNLEAGNAYGMTGSENIASRNWSTITPQPLSGSTTWQHFEIEIPTVNPGLYNLVFFWKNNASTMNQPPAAIDNILVDQISCQRPENIATTNIGNTSVNINWTSTNGVTWEFVISTEEITDFDDETLTEVSSATASIADLIPNTIYYFYLRTKCSELNQSYWSMISFRTKQTVATIPYEHDFAGTENDMWTLLNDTQTNKWYIGNTTGGANTVSEGLYISNDNGTSNTYTITSASYSYAYRTLNIATAGLHLFEFDWRAAGEGNVDVLRAFLVPESVEIEAGNAFGMTGSTNTVPTGWIDIAGGVLNQKSTWERSSLEIDLQENGIYNLVYFWKNDNSVGTNPPATVDNISIETISCPQVTSVVANNITASSADISWTRGASEIAWNIIISEEPVTDFTTATFAAENHTTPTYSMDNLSELTTYYVYVQAVCGVDNFGRWSNELSFTTTIIPATVPYECDFSDPNINSRWTLANGTQTNKWHIGSTTSGSNTVSEGLYISNDNGASNTYSTGSTSYVYAYRTIEFTQTGLHKISFDWRAYGESCCDYLRVFLVPASQTSSLTGGTTNSISSSGAPTGWIAITTDKLNYQSAWQSANYDVNISTSGVYQLVFFWKNDSSVGSQPPAAIDNVSVRLPSSENDILSFTIINGQVGESVINTENHTVTAEVRHDVLLTAVAPQIEVSPFATILPISGTVRDFTDPVTYTVTAENGVAQTWIASITNVPSPENSITAFELNEQGCDATIDDEAKTVTIMVEHGTDISNLTPTIEISGLASITPETGVAQDFTNPVTYTVTAQNGDVETWTVTVTELHEITCPNEMTVAQGTITDFTGYSPVGGVFSGTGVEGTSFNATGLARNTYSITYSYTYEGTNCVITCNFDVIVKSGENDITGFTINNQVCDAIIDTENHTVTLGLPNGIDDLLLMPNITVSEHATIYPFSGATQDFAEAVTYTVTAENGDAQDWVVNVYELPNVTCPDDLIVNIGDIVEFEGYSPIGGEFSGEGVVGNMFDATELESNLYEVTYTYTHPETECELPSCTFTVDVQVGVSVETTASVNLYPNPNSGKFAVNFSGLKGKVDYQILDPKGSILIEKGISVNDDTIENVSVNLAPGIYYLRITTEKQTFIEKLIVE